ncbi:MAG TPA: hypothetical protein VIH48_01810 [Candidatus Bathyarchaeia archaeon]
MKKLFVFAIALVLLMSALPVMAYTPPPPPPPTIPECAVKINDTWTWNENRGWYNFTGVKYCTDFTVDVWILDVVNLFGYSFNLTWNTYFFSLKSYTVLTTEIFPGSEIIVKPFANYTKTMPYEQAVAAYDSLPFNGSAKVATLTFHIDNDICYDQGVAVFVFDIECELVNQCSAPITPHECEDGYVALVPLEPTICFAELAQGNITKSKVGDTFTLTVQIGNAVRIKSIELWVKFDPDQQSTTLQDIVIYQDLYPSPYEVFELVKGADYVYLKIVRPCVKDSMNGSGRVVGITFKTVNPWPAPDFPVYTLNNVTTHVWTVENCTNEISKDGSIDGLCICPQSGQICPYVYDIDGPYVNNTSIWYTFAPIPGDLDYSGHVDEVDLANIAKAYGSSYAPWDFTGDVTPGTPDGVIDIYDVVVVAKNYCRRVP